jgi:hypothetical protein
VTAVALSLGGCGAHQAPAARAEPTPTTTPAQVLASAATRTRAASFNFTIVDDAELTHGVYDATTKALSLTASGDETTTFVVMGTEVYMSGLGGNAVGKLVHVDLTRLSPSSALLPAADALGALAWVGTAGGVEQSNRSFRGTVDLTKIDASAPAVTRLAVGSLAGHTRGGVGSLPFTATVDDQGRLTTFKTVFPGAGTGGKDLGYDLVLFNLGTTQTVTRPGGPNVVEASAELYQALGSA